MDLSVDSFIIGEMDARMFSTFSLKNFENSLANSVSEVEDGKTISLWLSRRLLITMWRFFEELSDPSFLVTNDFFFSAETRLHCWEISFHSAWSCWRPDFLNFFSAFLRFLRKAAYSSSNHGAWGTSLISLVLREACWTTYPWHPVEIYSDQYSSKVDKLMIYKLFSPDWCLWNQLLWGNGG